MGYSLGKGMEVGWSFRIEGWYMEFELEVLYFRGSIFISIKISFSRYLLFIRLII